MGKPDSAVFPYASGELLKRGLAALCFPERESTDGAASSAAVAVRAVPSLITLFERYIRELALFNAVFDLVGAETGTDKGRSDLVVRHILDSLAPWKEIERIVVAYGTATVEIADAGSGAGFPGIPLAIAFPSVHFTLVERMSKRCAFLENCVAMLALTNVTVLNAEVEKAPAEAFDIVVFRAFRPLDSAMTKTLLRMVKKPSGVLAAWKARKDKIEEEMTGIAGIVHDWRCVPLTVPFLEHEERNLVVIA